MIQISEFYIFKLLLLISFGGCFSPLSLPEVAIKQQHLHFPPPSFKICFTECPLFQYSAVGVQYVCFDVHYSFYFSKFNGSV